MYNAANNTCVFDKNGSTFTTNFYFVNCNNIMQACISYCDLIRMAAHSQLTSTSLIVIILCRHASHTVTPYYVIPCCHICSVALLKTCKLHTQWLSRPGMWCSSGEYHGGMCNANNMHDLVTVDCCDYDLSFTNHASMTTAVGHCFRIL